LENGCPHPPPAGTHPHVSHAPPLRCRLEVRIFRVLSGRARTRSFFIFVNFAGVSTPGTVRAELLFSFVLWSPPICCQIPISPFPFAFFFFFGLVPFFSSFFFLAICPPALSGNPTDSPALSPGVSAPLPRIPLPSPFLVFPPSLRGGVFSTAAFFPPPNGRVYTHPPLGVFFSLPNHRYPTAHLFSPIRRRSDPGPRSVITPFVPNAFLFLTSSLPSLSPIV